MYLLDTNVISELRKASVKKCHKEVSKWAKTVSSSSLFISVITILEIETGILLVERKDIKQGALLRLWLEEHVIPAFSDRIISIDTEIAQRCAQLHVPDPCPERDSLIAATALVHSMTVVTRNISDFESTGVELLNPWNPA